MFFQENLQGVCLTNQSKAVLKIRPEMKIKTKTVQLHCTLICYIKMKNVFLSRFLSTIKIKIKITDLKVAGPPR